MKQSRFSAEVDTRTDRDALTVAGCHFRLRAEKVAEDKGLADGNGR